MTTFGQPQKDGGFTQAELLEMSIEDLQAVREGRLRKESMPVTLITEGSSLNFSLPPSSPQDPYAPTAWLNNTYDFRTPSGQLCQMKKLDLAELTKAGILDKVTRLPGLTEGVIRQSEGQPPLKADRMPSKSEMEVVVEVLNVLLPMVVVQPKIWAPPEEGEEKVVGRVYVDSVDLIDRIAIMNRSLAGVADLDKFRH